MKTTKIKLLYGQVMITVYFFLFWITSYVAYLIEIIFLAIIVETF